MKLGEYPKYKQPLREVTVAYLLRDNEVLLATKKVNFGAGKIKGVGGKLEPGETPDGCVVREVQEELGVEILSHQHCATIDMYFPYERSNFIESTNSRNYAWNHRLHAYVVTAWNGTPAESEEVTPQWFKKDSIPFERMWADNQYWIPRILQGEQLEGAFLFSEDYSIEDFELRNA